MSHQKVLSKPQIQSLCPFAVQYLIKVNEINTKERIGLLQNHIKQLTVQLRVTGDLPAPSSLRKWEPKVSSFTVPGHVLLAWPVL